MIILEGPDGAGKTTLMNDLLEAFPIDQHERASTSEGGPVDNIFEWAQADVETWTVQPLSFYDRHPVISEPIYGTILRGGYDPKFDSREGQLLRHKLNWRALTIVCLPPVGVVIKNLQSEKQMKGVDDHIFDIYLAYQQRLITHGEGLPHTVFHYDYTENELSEFDDLCEIIEAHMVRWNRKNKGRIA